MTKSSKTPQAAPEIHAPEVDDQEPRIETRLNPAGLTIGVQSIRPPRR